ncbi:MAG: ATP-grasp domain-containing protein [Candidatus Omnitrophica bacterium]|nr:ATP-grasp domain-containing protein [Candidatus Omnitrophota bacterium]
MKILILSKKDLFALNIIRCLSKTRMECHVFGQGKMWSIILSKYCHKYVDCNFGTLQEPNDSVIDRINDYCLKHKISFVIAGDYETSYFFSRIKNKLSFGINAFPCSEPEKLRMLENKWEFSLLLEDLKLPYPRTVLVENTQQLSAVKMEFPRLVKPLCCEGGNVFDYIKHDQKAYLEIAQSKPVFPLIVQEFIPGIDVDLSILAHQGKIVAWSMQKWINRYTLQFFVSDELLELGRRIVSATNYEGVAHFDLRLDERDNSFKLIECNPRFWNSLRASWRNGVNFAELGLLLAAGENVVEQNISKNIQYIIPGMVFSELKKRNISILNKIPRATYVDLAQMLLDPLSFLCSLISRRL